MLSLQPNTTQADEPEKVEYTMEKNILYRDKAAEGDAWTDYMEERCRLDLYRPANVKGYPTVVWFHGGGLKNGGKAVPEDVKEKGIGFVAVNYRLSPQAKCPAYVEDAAAAVAWTVKHIEEFGGDPNLVFVSGHSAGGYLAAIVGLDKQYLAKFDVDANALAGLIPLSGQMITHSTIREEKGFERIKLFSDEMAPLHHTRADCPPVLFVTGDRELELWGRYEENAYMARIMKIAGHKKTTLYELDGFNHGTVAAPARALMITFMKDIEKKMKAEK